MAMPMDEEEDAELQRAFEMSLASENQPVEKKQEDTSSIEPDAKRSKASTETAQPLESMEIEKSEAIRQRELRAAAAEKRMRSMQKEVSQPAKTPVLSPAAANSPLAAVSPSNTPKAALVAESAVPVPKLEPVAKYAEKSKEALASSPENILNVPSKGLGMDLEAGKLTPQEAERLYGIVFGSGASPEVLSQWSRQGFRFSSDVSTSLGLVQKEGGPCGVLAPIQALLLKHLLYHPSDSPHASGPSTSGQGRREALVKPDLAFEDGERNRALVLAMTEALWCAGAHSAATVASLDPPFPSDAPPSDSDATFEERLRGVSLDSAASLSEVLSVTRCTTSEQLRSAVQAALPAFRSRLGALLFLFSALLSRGLDNVQGDRDDPEPPLVTRPFGHASQEIVNLLLCGQAVSNVFDGTVDLGGGMLVKGIPGSVQVGFLTLLEGLNLCKVGYHLKHPQWPIWVVGSESHYTVLFALSTSVQEESDAESREEMVRRSFDAHDTSGGGGFISPPDLEKLLQELDMKLPPAIVTELGANGIILWQDFWQAACNLDKSQGGYKGLSTPKQKRQFELLHFNGIAKSITNGGDAKAGTSGGVEQRPRLTRLKVTVPPKWTPDEMLVADSLQALKEEEAMHAPLVDCIRSRWQRATCNWLGQEPPSIV